MDTHFTRRAFATLLSFVIPFASVSKASTPPVTDSPRRIAVVVSTLENPWFVALAKSARARAEELGYEATIFDSHDDLTQETAAFDQIISSGYAAVLLNAAHAQNSVSNVLRARAAGIPTFCMDRVLASSEAAVSQILSHNYPGCVNLGEYFISQVGQKGTFIELLGLPSDTNTRTRSKGFHSVVDRFPEMKMVAQESADFNRMKAREVLSRLLKQHPQIDAVFCANDAMALGAYDALEDANIAKVKVFGFDGEDEVVKAIDDGKIVATVMQFPKEIARTAAEYADKYLRGDRQIPPRISVPVELVTRQNVRKFMKSGVKP